MSTRKVNTVNRVEKAHNTDQICNTNGQQFRDQEMTGDIYHSVEPVFYDHSLVKWYLSTTHYGRKLKHIHSKLPIDCCWCMQDTYVIYPQITLCHDYDVIIECQKNDVT